MVWVVQFSHENCFAGQDRARWRFPPAIILQALQNMCANRVYIIRIGNEAGIANHLRQRSDIGTYYRHTARHRFKNR